MIIVIPMNAEEDGSCKTIKAQYQQSSLANFVRGGGTWGATGVMVIEEDEDNTSNEHLRRWRGKHHRRSSV